MQFSKCRLSLVLLLVSSFTAQAQVDQIPYYIAGVSVNELLAKPIGKWIAQEQLSLNKTKPITSVVSQDLKFGFFSGLQAFLSYGLPALNQRAPAAPRLETIPEVNDRTMTPAPSTSNTLRITPSAADLSAVRIEVLQTDSEKLAAAFKAGAKYIAVAELVEYVIKIYEAYEKMHPHALTNANNQTALVSSAGFTDDVKMNPIAWFHWIEDYAKNAGRVGGQVMRALWDDKALTMYVAVHMAVAYMVTRFTMQASRTCREMILVNRGFNSFKADPFKQIFETTMGVFMSLYITPYITMPILAEAGKFFGIDTDTANDVADAAYMAGIKTPFAVDAWSETYIAGTIPVFMLGTFFTIDRICPFIRKIVTGTIFTVQLGVAYYKAKYGNPNAQHAHAH